MEKEGEQTGGYLPRLSTKGDRWNAQITDARKGQGMILQCRPLTGWPWGC